MKNPFLHPSGRAKFLESSLLPKSKFEQMVLAKDAEAALELLKDTRYGPMIHSKTAKDYQQIYGAAINSAYAEIKSIYEPLLSFFKMEYDFFNLKLIYKNRFGLLSFESAKVFFSEFGSFGKAAFESALKLETREIGKAFPEFEPVFAEIASVSKDNSDANLLEAAFDRQALENLYKNAPEILKP
ncbi:MAG: V-type ATPase subunit, partial [Candidatus Thermoplasmatota archaeon]|nr:V-type ATPase subunit [Candidatus Thermoplasmatota archaeon]